MGKAVLIYGGTFKERVETLRNQGVVHSENIFNPDLLIIEKDKERKSIGITSSREIKKFLQEKPLSKKEKTVVVVSAELMTTEAQNALLKVMEEPPSYAEIFLLSKTENSLLETVTSRCVKKRAEILERVGEGSSEINELLEMTLGERFDKSKELSDMEKEEIMDKLENWIMDLRMGESGRTNLEMIEKIVSAKKSLEETNVNQRLAIESLLLDL